LVQLISDAPLAFELVCKDTTLHTLGDALRMIAGLTPEQRDTYWWKSAIQMLNSASKETRYLLAATMTLETTLNLSGMLAQSPAPR
jgi:hypothetical protein